ncbi:DUF6294 family protein [Sphaerisporangium dianthi]|uniref:DUF6294 family protein n=1 Tax=Sphaerisporangium dianthi TaxID=1436120 RepID=A0ABV9C976_9ACTN
MGTMRRIAGMATAMGALTLGLALPATGAADASALAWKRFSWNTITAGDCAMSSGATWTIRSDGTADFDGTVSSRDGDDAWLMWARLKDANGAVLADIQVANSTGTKFVKGLPRAWQRYRWFARGHFDPSLYPLIKHMSLAKHC